MHQLPQVLRMLNTSTKQSQVAAQVSTAPACLKAEASPACCMCSCNFKFKSCKNTHKPRCHQDHQETRYKSPLKSPRCPQDKCWIHELVTFPMVLVMIPACPPAFLLDIVGSWHLCVPRAAPGLRVPKNESRDLLMRRLRWIFCRSLHGQLLKQHSRSEQYLLQARTLTHKTQTH